MAGIKEMTQTKTQSFTEAVVNVAIGLLVTLIFSPPIYWLCGVTMPYAQMGYVTVCFTALSVGRSYVVRRFFNKTN